MVGSFIFVNYTGDDAGLVLARMLTEDTDDNEHEVVTQTERVVGFGPNPEDEPESEEEDD